MISIFIVDDKRKICPLIVRSLEDAGYVVRTTKRHEQTDVIEAQEKREQEDQRLSFEDTVRQLEDFFVRSRERDLYKFALTTVEKPLVESVLNRTEGNQLKAANILGINRNTLRSKIKKLGIELEKWKRH